MPRDFSTREHFPCSADDAFDIMRDEDFLGWLLENSGGTDPRVVVEQTDDGWIITLGRTLPADVPSFARAMVGDHITVDEERVWGESDEVGVRRGTVTVGFAGAPLELEADLSLADDPEGGSTLLVEGRVTARIPLVGGKVEELARDQLVRFAAREEELVGLWLADDD